MFIAHECKRVIEHQPSWDVFPAYLTHTYWQKCWEEQSAVSNVDQITAADSLSLGLAWPLLLEKPYFTKELWGPTVYQPNDIWESLCLLWLLYPFQNPRYNHELECFRLNISIFFTNPMKSSHEHIVKIEQNTILFEQIV